jgi:hypothetical protein
VVDTVADETVKARAEDVRLDLTGTQEGLGFWEGGRVDGAKGVREREEEGKVGLDHALCWFFVRNHRCKLE